jgi:natural product biosynthesis luciferase-like monooxygenase protein
MKSESDTLQERIARLSPAERQQLEQVMRARGLSRADLAGAAAFAETRSVPERDPTLERQVDFSLMFFSDSRGGPYELPLEAAGFADRAGLTAVWIPERHFHRFGGLYPNPAVLGAALATATSHVRIRAGSVVMPLHHPLRVAEEWAMVDNLSGGRVEVAFASGWHESDFVLAPASYTQRRQVTLDGMRMVQSLWRGESVSVTGVNGEAVTVRTFPRPVQPQLPVWLTSAGNPETFRTAGLLGAHVLTALTGQNEADLRAKIEIYRAARQEGGYAPEEGKVALMLHTLVGTSDESVRALVREPMQSYLRNNLDLHFDQAKSRKMAQALPSFSPGDEQAVLDFAFERYFATSSLLGSISKCARIVERFARLGVTEIACLLDFGVEDAAVLAALPGIAALRDTVAASRAASKI